MRDEDASPGRAPRHAGPAPGGVRAETLALAQVLESLANQQQPGRHRPAAAAARTPTHQIGPAGRTGSTSRTGATAQTREGDRFGPYDPEDPDAPEDPEWLDLAGEVSRRQQIAVGQWARRLPYVACSATASAGWTAWGIGQAAYTLAGPGGELVVTTGTAGLCAVVLAALRLRWRRQIPAEWRRRWWLTGTAAGTWVTTAAAIGPGSWPMTAALVVGAAAASARWNAEHEVPRPLHDPVELPALPLEPERVALPAVVVEDEGGVLVRRWADAVAARGKLLPESMLTDRVELPHAIRWTVQTIPGSTTFDAVFAMRRRIAHGLQVAAAKVLLEPSDEDESSFTLTVIIRDVLAGGVHYLGPSYLVDGRDEYIPVGPWADGSGQAVFTAVDNVGVRGGLVTGEPGAGKSAFLESIGMGLRSSGRWWVMFGDGDPEGGSSPLLNQVASWAEAGPQGVLTQLEALEAVLVARGMLKKTLTLDPDTGLAVPITDPYHQRPLREIRPCAQFPGVMWIIDELQRLSSDPWLKEKKFIPRLERLARILRKYGGGVVAGTQSLLVGDYGGSTPLRGFLAARNLFAFRNSNKNEKAVVAGLAIAPSALPEGGGYAFSGNSGHLAMTRVAWSPDMADHAAGLPSVELDPDTALAVTTFRPAVELDPAAILAEQQARLAAWRAEQRALPGAPSPTPRPASVSSPPAASVPPPARAAAGVFSGVDQLQVPAALTANNVVPLRRPTAPSPYPSATSPAVSPATVPSAKAETVLDEAGPAETGAGAAQGPDLEVLTGAQRAVLDALNAAGRVMRSGEIAETTGMKGPAVSKALSVLADLGLAHDPRFGAWAAGPAPSSQTSGRRPRTASG